VNDRPTPLLHIEDLHVHFPGPRDGWFGPRRTIRAVDGVTLALQAGEILGLVGESGCGKSTTARAATRLLPLAAGRVRLDGVDLAALEGRALRRARRPLQMVFQDPYAALDPRWTVEAIVGEPLRHLGRASGSAARERIHELLLAVGLDPALARRYPHEFSGGQRQRIGIARALAAEPRVLVCDEPVSALDVSVQAQIINLLLRLRRDFGLAIVFIAHDLAVVRHIADRIAVMYAGRIVEQATTDVLFAAPQHPYTHALLSAIPVPDPERARDHEPVRGEPPSPLDAWQGCAYRARCPYADAACSPAPELTGDAHRVRCVHPLHDEPPTTPSTTPTASEDERSG